MKARVTCLVVALIASACGGDTVPTLLVNDLCEFDGPTTVTAGEVRLTLQRTGLGDYAAAVVSIDEAHSPDDLTDHFATVSSDWDDHPDWITVEYLLETRDEELTPDDHVGETTVMTLAPGEETVVCINYSDSHSEVAATIEVQAAD